MNRRLVAQRVFTWSVIGVFIVMPIMILLKGRYDVIVLPLFIMCVSLALISRAYLEIVPTPARKISDAWLLDSVRYYMRFGFFEKYAGLEDRELLRRIKAHWSRTGGDRKPEGLADILLLSLDKNRVFWGDIEADVMAENSAYASLLKSMSRVSRSSFNPTDISETWEGETGPIGVEFALDGVRHCIRPMYHDDWLDTQFVVEINRLIGDSGGRFRFCNTGGQDLVLIMLTDDETEVLRHDRGLALS